MSEADIRKSVTARITMPALVMPRITQQDREVLAASDRAADGPSATPNDEGQSQVSNHIGSPLSQLNEYEMRHIVSHCRNHRTGHSVVTSPGTGLQQEDRVAGSRPRSLATFAGLVATGARQEGLSATTFLPSCHPAR